MVCCVNLGNLPARLARPVDLLCLPSPRSHEPAASLTVSQHSPRPTTLADTVAATQIPGWHSLRATAPPLATDASGSHVSSTIRRFSATLRKSLFLATPRPSRWLVPKCPLIPHADTSRCAHLGHHPSLPTLCPYVTDRTLTNLRVARSKLFVFREELLVLGEDENFQFVGMKCVEIGERVIRGSHCRESSRLLLQQNKNAREN